MEAVNILVVDDKQGNLLAARNQFAGKNVNLLCCSLFSVAVKFLRERKLDILLTDLMIPGETEGISDGNLEIGKEVPYGLVLAIMAKNVGVKNVAILSDISHHAGPIAWAMDNLMGENNFVSCFNSKDWLEAAENFCNINDSAVKPIEVTENKKTLILAGCNDDYKKELDKILSNDFEVIFIEADKTKNLSAIVSEKTPDAIVLVGEIAVAEGIEKYSVRRVFNEVLSMKTPEQKIFVLGFLECNSEHYLRLPIYADELITKLSLKE